MEMIETRAPMFEGGRVPPREDCVLPALLNRRAQETPDKSFAIFDSGTVWSYLDAQRVAKGTAAALDELGVSRGDPVLVWMPNTEEIVRIHFGLSYLGAIFVPVNLALRGKTFEHIVKNSGAKVIIAHAQLVERLRSIDLGELKTLVVFGEGAPEVPSLRTLDSSVLIGDADNFREPDQPIEPWDTHGVFYTSGTTGPSKGVICTHVHTTVMGATHLRYLSGGDRFLINLPYFHMGAALVTFGALAHGVSFAMIRDYKTDTFMDEVRRLGATSCFLLGAHSTFLSKKEELETDSNNPLKEVLQIPLSPDTVYFSSRYDVDIHTVIDMTEMPPAIYSEHLSRVERKPSGFCGQVLNHIARFEVRIVDAHDNEVADGQAGELIARCDIPWVISTGYYNDPESSAKIWRNGWFHTGDLMRRDPQGNYYFVDRIKESLRRRGENISSAELENEFLAYHAVANAAAVAVKSDFGEDEVLVVIEAKPSHSIDPVDLTNFLIPRVPHYMVPRYIRIIEKMPYTDTNKVQKRQLKDEGITADTWDREKAGITVKRQRIA
jgi:carnitine-CoA ligase